MQCCCSVSVTHSQLHVCKHIMQHSLIEYCFHTFTVCCTSQHAVYKLPLTYPLPIIALITPCLYYACIQLRCCSLTAALTAIILACILLSCTYIRIYFHANSCISFHMYLMVVTFIFKQWLPLYRFSLSYFSCITQYSECNDVVFTYCYTFPTSVATTHNVLQYTRYKN